MRAHPWSVEPDQAASGERRHEDGCEQKRDLPRQRHRESGQRVLSREASAEGRAEQEPRDRYEARDDRDVVGSPERESEEHDVTGHVGGEDVPEPEDARGIDEPRHER